MFVGYGRSLPDDVVVLDLGALCYKVNEGKVTMSHDTLHLVLFFTRNIIVPAKNIVSGTVLVGAKVIRPGLAANAKPAALALASRPPAS